MDCCYFLKEIKPREGLQNDLPMKLVGGGECFEEGGPSKWSITGLRTKLWHIVTGSEY